MPTVLQLTLLWQTAVSCVHHTRRHKAAPFLVQRGRHQLPEGGGLDRALLPQLVQVVLELEQLEPAVCSIAFIGCLIAGVRVCKNILHQWSHIDSPSMNVVLEFATTI